MAFHDTKPGLLSS